LYRIIRNSNAGAVEVSLGEQRKDTITRLQRGAAVKQESDKTTHFGYREVPTREKDRLVYRVFESVAGNYDLMNDLMSLGVHRAWKRDFVANSGVQLGDQLLDLAGGTGDIAALLSDAVGLRGHVVLTDVNDAMLDVGRRRLEDRGVVGNVSYALVNAESLPFGNGCFDAVTIAFGLRNVTHKEAALAEMRRRVVVRRAAAAGQTGRRRRGQLSLPGGEYPQASTAGGACRDDEGCGFRRRPVPEPDRRHRRDSQRCACLTCRTIAHRCQVFWP
jgi:hypothetical protein